MSMATEKLPGRVEYERVIRPRHGLVAINFQELWRYRELFWQLTWRNILIRYKQTYLGVAWAVLQPLLTMVVFTIIFSRVAGMSSNGAPFPVFNFAALLPWMFFANALTESSNSLVASQGMITKIYFPRLIIPASAVLSGLVDFLISFVMLLLLTNLLQPKDPLQPKSTFHSLEGLNLVQFPNTLDCDLGRGCDAGRFRDNAG